MSTVSKESKFLKSQNFFIGIGQNVNFTLRAKSVPAPTGSQLLMISLKYLHKNTIPDQNLEGPFWFGLRNCIFKILNPSIYMIPRIKLKGSTFLSSLTMVTSFMIENVRKYLFQSM